jgi:hypothetical protein
MLKFRLPTLNKVLFGGIMRNNFFSQTYYYQISNHLHLIIISSVHHILIAYICLKFQF